MIGVSKDAKHEVGLDKSIEGSVRPGLNVDKNFNA